MGDDQSLTEVSGESLAPATVPVTIYHHPACGTSRNTLALIRNAGIEPTIIEYLTTPPARQTLLELLGRTGAGPRHILREK
jgi:arsenate reductase